MKYDVTSRRQFLRTTATLATGLSLTTPSSAVVETVFANKAITVQKGKQPNILVLFADQMHGFAMGCMNHPDVKTPNLDKLAAQGTLFRNAYSNSPICTAFRCALLTGRYGSQTNVLTNQKRIPEGERTFADAFNDAGYRTSYIGKWHLGATGNQMVPVHLRGGFTDFIGYQAYNDFINNVCFYDEQGAEHCSRDHRTKETSDIAIERLEEIADRKFAMVVSYQNPHYPEQPSLKYENLYKSLTPARRPNCTTNPDFDPYTATHSPRSSASTDPVYGDYGGDLDQYLRQYYAMITQMDAHIGRLLQTLDKLDIADNTVVIFTSDHGDMQGSHGLKNKTVAWEESTRIPMIVRAPGGIKGQVSDYLISGIDVFPSCLGFAGLPQEPTTEGVNFIPVVLGQRQLSPQPVFSEMSKWAMMRDGDYKLRVTKPDLTPTHLFNLEQDPYELNNLINDAAHNSIKQQCLTTITEWYSHVLLG